MHPLDFGGLVIGDVIGKFEQHRVVCRTRLVEQLLDHRHRPFVVGDHQLQEHPVEVGALGRGQFRHLLRRGHAGHSMARVHRIVIRRDRHLLAAVVQPPLHELHFVLLGQRDAPRRIDYLRPIGAIFNEFGHLHRLVVVRNHVLHEPDVIRRVARHGNVGRLFGRKLPRRLARRARLDDGGLGSGGGGHTEQQHAREGALKQS